MDLPETDDVRCSYLWTRNGIVVYEGKMQFLELVVTDNLTGFFSCMVKCRYMEDPPLVSAASEEIVLEVDPTGSLNLFVLV